MARRYVALPSASKPLYLLPVDDAGAFDYFVNYVLSSRHPKRRWAIAALRAASRVGAHRLWPLAAGIIAWAQNKH